VKAWAAGIVVLVILASWITRHSQVPTLPGIAGIQPGNAQTLHATVDNLPMCLQNHGHPIMIPLRDKNGVLLVYEGCE
jgi:hypothetical protein